MRIKKRAQKKFSDGHPGTARHEFWRLYVVMCKPKGEKWFRPFSLTDVWALRQSEDVVAVLAYQVKKDAEEDLQKARQIHGKRRAYLQMVGAYR